MYRKTLAVLAFSLALVGVAGFALAGPTDKLLDSRTFTVQLIPGEAETGDPDTLTFNAGMFDSSACHAYGFGKSAYTAKQEGEKIAFEVQATSKTQDKQLWKGTVEGNKIQGTMQYTDAKGVVTHYRFHGQAA